MNKNMNILKKEAKIITIRSCLMMEILGLKDQASCFAEDLN